MKDICALGVVLWWLWCPAVVQAQQPDTVHRIPEVTVTGLQMQQGTLQRIETEHIRQLPNPSGNFEALLKALAGVSSNNELSAQYSVRGGNFDENLVYVNNIEIRRPILIRSGQQEGLSFINPDLVASVNFSAGGFGACYGDKMSSVLDVQYRVPSAFHGTASVSLLGATASVEGLVKNRFSYLLGARYKTSKYLLGTLDTQGDYDPRFVDVQGLFHYKISPRWDADMLVNFSNNRYFFAPDHRVTNFGSLYESYQLNVYYDGMELDTYNSGLNALTLTHCPSDRWKLKWTGVAGLTSERETFDIESAYWLSELENNRSDSIMRQGVGSELSHARNYLNTGNFSFTHTGTFREGRKTLDWSVAYQRETADNRLNEWVMIDSAGYSVPYNGTGIPLKTVRTADNHLTIQRAIAWLQYQQHLSSAKARWTFTAGLRFHYSDANGESLWSPRVSATVRPYHWSRLSGHLAVGMYAQPPSYREMRDIDGQMHSHIKAQRSLHYIIGGDYLFSIGEKPFKLSSELYYKQLSKLIPYRLENVRICYAGENMASGYVTGWDVKLNGEFVKDAESWVNLSLMRAREDITADGTGSFPLPSDQWFNFNLFFQDYFPMAPTWRVFLNLNYGSPLPYSYPDESRFDKSFRMPAYRRVDIGLSKVFFKDKPHTFIRQMALNVEVFNLFDTNNTISYFWMQVVNNLEGIHQQFAIPNYLTARRLNLKVSIAF
ncbi:MAG: TonB-dependent receptor plug domain-containing protein [Bacteroidales bacterium]|jgi:hypothetical protein|nr:TonB-dependent receptor plug domain-containing protein [Bacteroidales bacterium]